MGIESDEWVILFHTGTTLLSIKKHMKYKGCYFHAEDNAAILAFPDTIIAVQTEPEMHVYIAPANNCTAKYTFNEADAILSHPTRRRKYTIIDKTKASLIPPANYSAFTDIVKVKKLVREATLPQRATIGSAGFDVTSTHDATLPPHSQTKIHTGLAMAVPSGIYLRIAPSSSLAMKV